jgi:kinesin family protein 6/9
VRGSEISIVNEDSAFQFSHLFGPEASQAEVFAQVAQPLILGALDGVNCTIFAYGQSGSGKTHTMCGGSGCHSLHGIIPRALSYIFEEIAKPSRQDAVNYSISVSFIEVYKEVGYDLLAKEFGRRIESWPVVSVSLQNDEPVLQGARRVLLSTENEGLRQYFIGDAHRKVAETPHNLNSSRSHCIFTIFIRASDRSTGMLRMSKVQIVDLAGSERLRPNETGWQYDKGLMEQTVSINLSLHWLEVMINSLNQNGSKAIVPFRNSFLTKVLKDALGGNARAVMITTINPAESAHAETVHTCRFAMRVAKVRTHAHVNIVETPDKVIAALRQNR